MFDFIRKPFLWDSWDRGLDKEISSTGLFHLKSIQDLAVYDLIKGSNGKSIAEIGGGDSRILAKLAKSNNCVNVEKFQGADGGPKKEIKIPGVRNIHAFLGERSGLLEEESFDILFSVSVVEHVPSDAIDGFRDEGIAVLKTGGLWLHAIDLYLEDEPSKHYRSRYDIYKSWATHPDLEPIGPVFDGPLAFTCDMATNPDNVMYTWGKVAPQLIPLRQVAQSVSVIVACRKR